jgi:hypothetical protein
VQRWALTVAEKEHFRGLLAVWFPLAVLRERLTEAQIAIWALKMAVWTFRQIEATLADEMQAPKS